MKKEFPRFKVMGERAILIEFEPEISPELLEKLLYYKEVLEIFYIKSKVEVINTYSSLLVNYLFTIEDLYSEVSTLQALLKEAKIEKKVQKKLFKIPVCYDPEFGLDLQLISKEKKLSLEEIVKLHTDIIYTVYFIGFLPGFLYLGGLDPRLWFSRKIEPRLQVQKGAVGIGEKQTGIYPKTSPGGWQIIGNSPVEIFNKNKQPPCNIFAGDRIRFYPVSKEEHLAIKEEVQRDNFQLETELYDS